MRFRVTVDAEAGATTLANEATIAYVADTIDAPFTHVTNRTETPVAADADLSVTKVSAPNPVAAGADLTSTIVVTNNGPNTALGVVLTDEVSPGVVPLSATPATCAVAGQTVTCALGDLADGEDATVTVTARAPPGSTVSASTDVARVSSTTIDPDPSDNAVTVTVGVVQRADVAVTKTAVPTTVVPGSIVTFPITVTNNGPSTALGVNVSDVLDSAFVDVTATAPCEVQSNAVQCPLGDLAPGESESLTITARLDPATPAGTVITNTADASTLTPDLTTANNSSSVTVTTATPQSDLNVTKVVSPTSVVAGAGGATYTITVTNDGPSTATGVELTDASPPAFTVVSGSSSRGSCTLGLLVSCTIDELPVGTSARFTLDVVVPGDTAPGPIINTASVSGDQQDPDVLDNTASATLNVTTSADLVTIKQGPAQLVPGGTGTYEITVSNSGPSTALDVALVDQLPAGIVVDQVVPSVGTCAPVVVGQPLTCQLGDISPDDPAEVDISYTVDSAFPDPQLVNTASASSVTPDPVPSNNQSVFTSSTGAQADLIISKLQTPIPPVAGGVVSWDLRADNSGPSAAVGVVITDTLPAGLTDISVPAGCTLDVLTVTCPVGTLDSGDTSATFTIAATVPLTMADGTLITNTAAVTSTTPDPSPSNNTRTVASHVVTRADLVVVKSTSPALPAGAGQPTFTIDVSNNGPSIARNVRLVDVLPFDAIIELVEPAILHVLRDQRGV